MGSISKTSLAIWGLFAVIVVGAAVAFFCISDNDVQSSVPGLEAPAVMEISRPVQEAGTKAAAGAARTKGPASAAKMSGATPDAATVTDDEDSGPAAVPDSEEEEASEAEKAAKEWTELIDTFYAADPPRMVTRADRARAKAKFDALADADKDENIHHAMNLLPDESVALVYDILFDKTEPADVIDVIFSDILNRDEAIKNPVMKQIAADRGHPSWFESVRILDIVLDDDEKDAAIRGAAAEADIAPEGATEE